jgi:calcineurin-like phosphoesterase family protein
VIVHGHTHDKTRLTAKNTVHVGVDGWDYRPARFEEVEPLVEEAYRRKQQAHE